MKIGLLLPSLLVMLSAGSAAAQASLQTQAEAVFQSSCGVCHNTSHPLPFVDDQGEVIWSTIEQNAARIVEVVENRIMPPPRAPDSLQITEEQRADLLDYVKTLLPPPKSKLPLESLVLPEGFRIEVLAEAAGARSLAVHESGVIFVGTGAPTNSGPQDTVYAIVPTLKDGVKVVKFRTGLDSPNGVALHNNDLYVAESTRILRFANAVPKAIAIAENSPSAQLPRYTVIKDDFPRQENHYWKYLAVGPDEKLYVPIGADCNVCLPEDRTSTAGIFRLNLDGSGYENIAIGVRNTVGFDWHPVTRQLWFTDNGRDLLGDDIPSDELNRLPAPGADFGFPFCFAKNIVDPTFGADFTCNEPAFTKPVVELGAHVAALGLTHYRGEVFPPLYQQQLFIAEHGSWNRSEKSGYRVRAVLSNRGGPMIPSYADTPFITGWLNEATQENWGRPVDVKTYVDGSLIISDDYAGVIYRVTYEPGKGS